MAVVREFWGWDKPVLELAAEALMRRAAGTASGPADLARLLVIVPTRQAGRRLRERLAAAAAARGAGVFPPRILQPDALLKRAGPGLPPTATAEEMLAAFAGVLRGNDPAALPDLFPEPLRRAPPDFRRALDIAEKLCELRKILGDRGLLFRDVPALLEERLEGDTGRFEPERWEDLAKLELLYLEQLARNGLSDPNAARRAAAEAPELPEGVEEILVLAVPDPAPLAVDALARLAERGVPVTVCVHAPPELHEQFDDWGRPIAKLWLNRQVDIADGEIRLAGLPADAARETADWIARLGAAPADIAVGTPDPAVIPHLRRRLADRGGKLFDPAGKPLAAHPAAQLALTLAELRADGRFAAFASLLRHPDVLRHLRARLGNFDLKTLLTDADTFQNHHLPETFDSNLCQGVSSSHPLNPPEGATGTDFFNPGVAEPAGVGGVFQGKKPNSPARSATPGVKQNPWQCHSPEGFGGRRERHPPDAKFAAAAAEIARLVEKVGDDLRGLANVLQEVYTSRPLRPGTEADDDFAEAAVALLERLGVLEGTAAAAVCSNAGERLEFLRRTLPGARYYADPEPADAVEAQGWLELPWNDAPHLALTGFNEGFVPDTVTGHAFLPDAARAALGLPHNEQRFVRDIYLLSAMLAWRRGRAGRVLVTACKTDAEKEPLRPSRLLFLCEDSRLAARAERLFGSLPDAPAPPPRELAWKLAPARRTLEHMRVTDFAAYLACPAHFRLQRVLGMGPLDDRAQELDALAFGTLCHSVLKDFADAPPAIRDSADPETIRRFVEDRADARLRDQYGDRLPATLLFQHAALKARLAHFAQVQAAHRAAGWRILHAESAIEGFALDGMPVSGRIDRLDENERDGRLLVLDYKTSDKAETPEDAHLAACREDADVPEFVRTERDGKPAKWTDLQLPLYLLALEGEGKRRKAEGRSEGTEKVAGPILAGYFSLPKAVTETRIDIWRPEPEQLASAERCAKGVVAAVRAGVFWPPVRGAWNPEFDDLAAALVPEGCAPEECLDDRAFVPREGGAA